MTKKPTDLDDIAGAITDLGTLVAEQFRQVDKRFEQVDKRFDGIEKTISDIQREQGEMRKWLVSIDGRLVAVENDIKEIYSIITTIVKKDVLTTKDKKELERQMAALFEWANQVSKQTGVALPKL